MSPKRQAIPAFDTLDNLENIPPGGRGHERRHDRNHHCLGIRLLGIVNSALRRSPARTAVGRRVYRLHSLHAWIGTRCGGVGLLLGCLAIFGAKGVTEPDVPIGIAFIVFFVALTLR